MNKPATTTTIQAINAALHDAMAADPKVLVLGEDIGDREEGGVVGEVDFSLRQSHSFQAVCTEETVLYCLVNISAPMELRTVSATSAWVGQMSFKKTGCRAWS